MAAREGDHLHHSRSAGPARGAENDGGTSDDHTIAGGDIRIFSVEEAVVRYGVACLRWVSIGYPFYAWGMVMVQAFNGAGDTYTPTVINVFCYWIFQLPFAYLLAMTAGQGPTGVFVAITVAESLIAVVGVLVFRRGRWKLREV